MSNSETTAISNQNDSESPPSPLRSPSLSQPQTPPSLSNFELPFRLLNGEYLVDLKTKFSVVYFISNNDKIRGKIYITNFRFYFKSEECIKQKVQLNDVNNDNSIEEEAPLNELHQQSPFLVLDLALGLIHRIEKLYSTNSQQVYELTGLLINCKNGRKLRIFKVDEDQNFERFVYDYLYKYAFPISNSMNYFAFSFKPDTFSKIDGWLVYDAEREYNRMGITIGDSNKKWRITEINKEYRFCETYPRLFVVPSCISDEELKLVAEFRSKNRIPVLSWVKFDNENQQHFSAIFRSSQPLCGMSGKRNYYDENYLKSIAELNDENKILHILDARPYINALANCTTGGGYENEKYYYTCRLSFLNIENIHAMRDSLGANTNDRDFSTNLENSKWLEHIKLILDGTLKVVQLIDSNFNILVHCSDGWDRTAQLTSLSMLVLDKYYRTIEGFQVLIEKEWLSFGHRFGVRMGHGSDKYSDQDRSPIFLQFIDCVWQILQQNKKFFEFNENFLIKILDNMFTCQYGTFLMDSEYEREKHKLKSNTVSLWSNINDNLSEFTNSEYLEYDQSIKFSTSFLKLWTTFYFQFKDTTADLTNANSNGTNGSLQKVAMNSVGNLFENIAPNGLNLLSNGFKLFNHIKSNLRN